MHNGPSDEDPMGSGDSAPSQNRCSGLLELPGTRPAAGRDGVWLRMSGNAMAPEIRPGDLLLCTPQGGSHLLDGAVYVIEGPGGLRICRLRLEGEFVTLVKDNPSLSNERVAAADFEDKFQVHARVSEVRSFV